jgi:PAS domain S-box-containing protein
VKPDKASKHKPTITESGFRALIEHAHEGIVVYDSSGYIKFASKSVKKVCGYSEKEVLGNSGTFFIHPHDVAEARKAFLKLLNTPGKSVKLFQRIKHKKGHFIWAESILTNFSHLPGVEGVVSNFRDITEQKVIAEEAFRSQELLETINRNLSEGIYMGIIKEKFLHVNQAFLKMFGYRSLQEVQRIKPSDIYEHPKDTEKILRVLRKNHFLKGVETSFKRKNGEVFWGILNVSLLKHEGKENYFVGTIRDITAEKEAAAALEESRNFLTNIINTVAAPIFVKDEKHRWLMFNKKFADLIGRSQRELQGKTDRDFLPRKEADAFWKVDNEVLSTGKTISVLEKITSRKGDVHDLLTLKSAFTNDKKEKFLIGFITDITQLKNAEERINQLNANLRGVLESTKESIYAVDSDFNYITFNHNHKRIMKLLYDADIEVGKNKLDYLKGSVDYAWVKAEILKALEGRHFVSEHHLQYAGFTGYIRTTFNPIRNSRNEIMGAAVFVNNVTERKQFEEIIKSINANLRGVLESTNDQVFAVDRDIKYITFNKAHTVIFKKLFNTDIAFGESFLKALPPALKKTARFQIQRALGGEQFIIEEQLVKDIVFEVSLNPIRNEAGIVTGVAIFSRDVSLRKTIEERLRQLNEELLQQNAQLAAQEQELKTTLEELSERNFELDQLMYKTSHDLRSPLSSIMGLVNLANLDNDTSNHHQYLSKIEGRIKKLDEFISSMLNYARVNRTDMSPEVIDLKEVAIGCIRELEYLENFKSVQVQLTESGNDVPFISDRLRVQIIFSNIISNAYKYYNPEAISYLKINIAVTSHYATLEFIDNGIGIKTEYLSKIFNMFYRATDRSQGSGLGMYIVKQAVEKLRGQIQIASEHGKGTNIKITLPNS